MKVNQVLTIELLDGSIKIGHLDHIGSLTDLFEVGNRWRVKKGLPLIRYDKWLTLSGTKEFIAKVSDELGYPAVKSKRGRSGGIWAHLYILLDAAAYLSADLKYEVYKKFVEGKILEWRDRSGDNFIELNAAVALNAEEVFGKPAHTGHYINLAKIIKSRCDVEDWNNAKAKQLNERARIEEVLATMLKINVVRDWDHLKELAEIV